MNDSSQMLSELGSLDTQSIEDLTRRVQDINNSYRAVAEKMGQLYMCADELKVAALTQDLDKPMRNASDNEQMFAALLEELQTFAHGSPG